MANPKGIARIMSPAEAAGVIEIDRTRRFHVSRWGTDEDPWRGAFVPDSVIGLARDRSITDEERGRRLRELAKSEKWPRARRSPSDPAAKDDDTG